MKAPSIWQPWATLIMSGHKKIETRGWAAPYSIRGQRIAIASTGSIRPEQHRAGEGHVFRDHYCATGLIPTCVGKAIGITSRATVFSDHPHVCGER